MPGNASILCNMVVTKFFLPISKPNNPKIVRKYGAAWNFLKIYFEMLSDCANEIIIIIVVSVDITQTLCLFFGFHRNIELKTSNHEFADIIHQNKQGFDGKKRS